MKTMSIKQQSMNRVANRSAFRQRTFGIEIESIIHKCAALRHRSDILSTLDLKSNAAWNVVDDKSIMTSQQQRSSDDRLIHFEIVSPVLSYTENNMATLQQVCDGLLKLQSFSNDSCGFHVHFDGSDLSISDLIRIGINYAFFEDVIDLFMDASRSATDNAYIKSIQTPIYKHHQELIDILENCNGYNRTSLSVLDMMNPYRKCHKFNFTNFVYYNLCRIGISKHCNYINTIENRHHHSTLCFEDIVHWVQFNMLFIHCSKDTLIDRQLIQNDMSQSMSIDQKMQFLADFLNDDDVCNFYQHKLMQRV